MAPSHILRIKLLVLMFCLAACAIGQAALAQPGGRVVAEVGRHTITFEELAAYERDGLYPYLYQRREEAFGHALQDLVTDELKRIDLFASGLARDGALGRELARNVTEELVVAYGEDQYERRYLNAETMRAEHEAMGRVVHHRQIVLRKPPDASDAVLDSLRATVRRIQQHLEDGTPFEALLHHYVLNGMVPRQEGRVETITWKQTTGSPRAYILFHLSPGEVRSFEGPATFSVAQVERVEHVPVPPLDEVRDAIVEALQSRHAARETAAFQKEWRALVDTTALTWNPATLEQVVAWANTRGFFEGDYRTTIARYLARHDDHEILADGRGELRLSDLPRLFDEVQTLRSSGGHDTEFIQDFLLEAVRNERLAARARELGLYDRIWQADTPSPVLARAFVRYYDQKHIEAQIPAPTETALRTFYETHADSLFYQLARVSTEIIVRSDANEIEALWQKVQQGAPFEEVSTRRLIRTYERTRDGEIVTRNTREPAYLGHTAFGLQAGEVAGPVAYEDAKEGRLYAIVRATRRLEERQLAFDEARDRVAEAFAEHHRARLKAEVAADLRARYPVTIHRDVLDRVLAASR